MLSKLATYNSVFSMGGGCCEVDGLPCQGAWFYDLECFVVSLIYLVVFPSNADSIDLVQLWKIPFSSVYKQYPSSSQNPHVHHPNHAHHSQVQTEGVGENSPLSCRARRGMYGVVTRNGQRQLASFPDSTKRGLRLMFLLELLTPLL